MNVLEVSLLLKINFIFCIRHMLLSLTPVPSFVNNSSVLHVAQSRLWQCARYGYGIDASCKTRWKKFWLNTLVKKMYNFLPSRCHLATQESLGVVSAIMPSKLLLVWSYTLSLLFFMRRNSSQFSQPSFSNWSKVYRKYGNNELCTCEEYLIFTHFNQRAHQAGTKASKIFWYSIKWHI